MRNVAGSGKARTVVAVYVALAAHALLALGLALAPDPQDAAGAGVGLSAAGAGLDEVDRRLALASPATAAASPATRAPAYTAMSQDVESERPNAATPRARAAESGWDRNQAGRPGGGGEDGYFARLRAHLAWFRSPLPPRWAGARALIRVELTADGAVRAATVEQGSGIEAFDAEALALVGRASPFPSPPRGQAMRLVIPIELVR